MKKKVFSILIIALLFNILSVSAINLDISTKAISNTYIIEFDEPAIFELTLRNLENIDETLEIYSLVGVDIEHQQLLVGAGETKKIKIRVTPQESLKINRESPLNFEYKIKNLNNEIQKGSLSMKILRLNSIFSIIPDSIHPETTKISIDIKNNIIYDFPEVEFEIESAFFTHKEKLSLKPNERKQITVQIDKEKLKTFDAGAYLINTKVTTKGKSADIESQIKYLEEEGIEASDNTEGFFIKRIEIIRKNTGNVKKTIEIETKKGILSYLFTTTSVTPSRVKTSGLNKVYYWEKELIPNEEFKVIVKTNWFIPLIIIIILFFGMKLIRRNIYRDLEVKKKVSFVKTKGGQFALKVTIKLKAKDFVERINVVDKLPPLVKLYNKFGILKPNKIDLDNKRIEWNFESLNKDETRILNYIIYSKIGVVGKFELPETTAFYEKEGKIKESVSNRSFYVNEPKE